VSRRLVLAFAAAAFAVSAFAGSTEKILKTETPADAAPGESRLTVVDTAGKTREFSVNGSTRVMRDGKKTTFDTALLGDLVVRAKFDPKTKTLSVLELKSSGMVKSAAAAPGPVTGEAAFVDAIKGELSVKLGPGRALSFTIGETTKVLRETAGKPDAEVGFETVTVGDSVEVRSRDGKTADEIRVRPAAR
jgi:hypothetical protein